MNSNTKNMKEPKFRLFATLDEFKNEFPKIEKEWENIKKTKEVQFPEYTDEKIKELKYLLFNKSASKMGEVRLPKAQNIIFELDNLHFLQRIDLHHILFYCTASERIKYFIQYNNQLQDDKYWEILAHAYTTQDYSPVPYPILLNLFKSIRNGRENIMNEEELEFFQNLPNEFNIYRAMSKNEFQSGSFRLSWTLDKKIAQKFVERNTLLYQEEMIVHNLLVNKADIIAYLNGRNEKEIIYIEK